MKSIFLHSLPNPDDIPFMGFQEFYIIITILQNKAVDFLERKFEEKEQGRGKQMTLTLLETLFGTQEGDSISIGWNLKSTLLWPHFLRYLLSYPIVMVDPNNRFLGLISMTRTVYYIKFVQRDLTLKKNLHCNYIISTLILFLIFSWIMLDLEIEFITWILSNDVTKDK